MKRRSTERSRGGRFPAAIAVLCLMSLQCGTKPEDQSLLGALNRFYAEHVPGYDSSFVRRQVRNVATTVASRSSEPTEEAIGRVLFGDGGLFEYCPNEVALVYRPDAVFRERRGNCLGLATVFLLVAEHLGVHAYAVQQPPSHVVVGSRSGCWDPTRRFVAIDAATRAAWARTGSHRWFGVALPRERLVCIHIATQATVNLVVGNLDEANRLHRMALRMDHTEPLANQAMADGAILRSDWDSARRYAQLAYESSPSETSRALVSAVREHEVARRTIDSPR